MRKIKNGLIKDMLKNRISLRNLQTSSLPAGKAGENFEPATKPYQIKIRRGAVKNLQPKFANCSRNSVLQHVLNISSVLFVLALFYFLGRKFYELFPQIAAADFSFNVSGVLLALFLYTLAIFMLAFLWFLILQRLHIKTNFLRVCMSYISSLFGKYVPGKIWGFVIRLRITPKKDISKTDIILTSLLENILMAASGIGIGTIAIFRYFSSNNLWIFNSFLIFILTIIFLYPGIFYFIFNKILIKLNKPIFEPQRQASYFSLLFLMVQYLVFWCLVGTSFFVLFNAFYLIPISRLIDIISIFGLAYGIGYITVISPGGLGVREGIWFIFLSKFLPQEIAIIMSVFSRLLNILAEIVGIILAVIFYKISTALGYDDQA